MSNAGSALMALGVQRREIVAVQAAQQAIDRHTGSVLLTVARGILFNVIGRQ